MCIHQLDLLDHLHGKVVWKSATMACGIQFVFKEYSVMDLVILKPVWFVSRWGIPLEVISCVN